MRIGFSPPPSYTRQIVQSLEQDYAMFKFSRAYFILVPNSMYKLRLHNRFQNQYLLMRWYVY